MGAHHGVHRKRGFLGRVVNRTNWRVIIRRTSRRAGRQQTCDLRSQRQQCEQVKDEFNRQPRRSQSNSSCLVVGHLGNSSLAALLEFRTKHNALRCAVTAITARAIKRAARRPPSLYALRVTLSLPAAGSAPARTALASSFSPLSPAQLVPLRRRQTSASSLA
jgi:hypothetical protein